MELNDLKLAFDSLEPGTDFRIVNNARPSSDYLFLQFLPEIYSSEYHTDDALMTVISTMAEMVGMDSPYPEAGAMKMQTISERTVKLATQARFTEATMRQIQGLCRRHRLNNQSPTREVIKTLFNLYEKLIVQPHMDTAEWLRGRAIFDHELDWYANNIHLDVDYNLKAGSKLTALSGNNTFAGSTSQFWPTIIAMRRFLKYNIRAFITDPLTVDNIVSNPVNNLEIVSQTTINEYLTSTTVTRLVGDLERRDRDSRYTATILAYSMEAEVMNADNKTTKIVPFVKTGEFAAIANNTVQAPLVNEGGTPGSIPNNRVGFTHVGPTVEGDGAIGRWGRSYIPENQPWGMVLQGVSNILPMIVADDKICSIKNNYS